MKEYEKNMKDREIYRYKQIVTDLKYNFHGYFKSLYLAVE